MNRQTQITYPLFIVALLAPSTVSYAQPKPFEEPKIDRDKFAKSAQSIARPDLLACRNLDAKISVGSDVDIQKFAKTLNGVWVNQNGRSVHGKTVETDTAFYVNMTDSSSGTAILIDRNNLGSGTMSAPFKSANKAVERPMSLTFVNCTYQFVDEYIKVSDKVDPRLLAKTTRMKLKSNGTLLDLWDTMVKTGYFDSFNQKGKKVTAVLGDGKRLALLRDGTQTDEAKIEQGRQPGAEYNLPMVTGALFKISLKPTTGGPFRGVQMRWDGEYRGVGIDLPIGKAITGIEEGEYLMEGNSFVSPAGPGQWRTSECGNKNGLSKGTDVSNPNPVLTFERVVMGTP